LGGFTLQGISQMATVGDRSWFWCAADCAVWGRWCGAVRTLFAAWGRSCSMSMSVCTAGNVLRPWLRHYAWSVGSARYMQVFAFPNKERIGPQSGLIRMIQVNNFADALPDLLAVDMDVAVAVSQRLFGDVPEVVVSLDRVVVGGGLRRCGCRGVAGRLALTSAIKNIGEINLAAGVGDATCGPGYLSTAEQIEGVHAGGSVQGRIQTILFFWWWGFKHHADLLSALQR
jgi:hypothetical protein